MDIYTFGDSKAAVNLVSSVLEKDEYSKYSEKVAKLLSKQIHALNSVCEISDKSTRETSLRFWHERFREQVSDLPETVRTHVLCVEAGIYRKLLRDGLRVKR